MINFSNKFNSIEISNHQVNADGRLEDYDDSLVESAEEAKERNCKSCGKPLEGASLVCAHCGQADNVAEVHYYDDKD